jgi:putative phosphoribosyl transferase
MAFASRADAGRQLARRLQGQGVEADRVLGLPRGGVVVAAEVAHELKLPLDTLVVRKIGHPLHREFAVGALAEAGVVVLDQALVGDNPLARAALGEVIEEEKQRLQAYQDRFHRGGPATLSGARVLLVDDGLATGATTEAAVRSARRQGAYRVIVAAPVASANAVARLRPVADAVVVLWEDPDFDAVGRYYDVFEQTSDEEVLELLNAA